MTTEEILKVLQECTNFDGTNGAINQCPECKDMTQYDYSYIHYPKMVKKLESLPWTKVVKDPRNPKPDEYPTEDGEYLVMLDVDEHAVWTNTFRNGHWCIYDKTHVKWWMPWKRKEGPMGLSTFCHVISSKL